MRTLLRLLRYLFQRRRFESDLAEEMALHREMKERELTQNGVAPTRRRARDATGARQRDTRTRAFSRGLDMAVARGALLRSAICSARSAAGSVFCADGNRHARRRDCAQRGGVHDHGRDAVSRPSARHAERSACLPSHAAAHGHALLPGTCVRGGSRSVAFAGLRIYRAGAEQRPRPTLFAMRPAVRSTWTCSGSARIRSSFWASGRSPGGTSQPPMKRPQPPPWPSSAIGSGNGGSPSTRMPSGTPYTSTMSPRRSSA